MLAPGFREGRLNALEKNVGQPGKPMEKKIHINFWYVTGAILLTLWIQSLYLASTKSTPIPYSRFRLC